MTTAAVRSAEEIDKLKREWRADPCWDIEDTEGFEAHREELLAFSQKCHAEWDLNAAAREQQRQKRLHALAEKLGCPGNIALAEYVENLEQRLAATESRLAEIEPK